MSKGLFKDRVLEDARNKAFRMTNFPKSIREKFNISIKSGSIILTQKKIRNIKNRFELMDI